MSTPQNHDAWLKQVAVPCPKCIAAAGEPCRDLWGGEIRGTHNARKKAAEENQ